MRWKYNPIECYIITSRLQMTERLMTCKRLVDPRCFRTIFSRDSGPQATTYRRHSTYTEV